MRAVNLLPQQASSRKLGVDRVTLAAIAFTVVVVATLAGGFFLEKAHASNARQELAAAQAAFASALSQQPTTHSPAPAHLQIPVVLSQQQPWHVALDTALATRVSWDVLLSQLEYVVPANVTLTNVTVGGAAGSAGSGTITIGGTAFSSNDIAVFLSTLARVPKVSQVNLVSSTGAPSSKVVTFTISAQLSTPAPVTAPATDTTTTTGG